MILNLEHFMNQRFRGFLPVVIDVETGGLVSSQHALLEIAVAFVTFTNKKMVINNTLHYHIEAHPNTTIDNESLKINKIIPNHPFRYAVSEKIAFTHIFSAINKQLRKQSCSRAILVGHNAAFDLSFIQAACERNNIKESPLHKFSTIDTVSLAALAYGETTLAKALAKAKINFNPEEAHGALYDTIKTAELFCQIVNNFPFSHT